MVQPPLLPFSSFHTPLLLLHLPPTLSDPVYPHSASSVPTLRHTCATMLQPLSDYVMLHHGPALPEPYDAHSNCHQTMTQPNCHTTMCDDSEHALNQPSPDRQGQCTISMHISIHSPIP